METLTANRIPTVTQMNQNFVIKWRLADERSSWNKLIGAGRYVEKFGTELMQKHFDRAMNSGERKIVIKVRGRYVITFASR